MDMSDAELKELHFAILVELQNLVCCKLQILAYQMRQLTTQCHVMQETSVPVLLGEALLATDKRHCAALTATLRGRQYQGTASFFRYGRVPTLVTLCSMNKGLCAAAACGHL